MTPRTDSQRAADLLRRGQVKNLNAVDVGPNEIGLAMKSDNSYSVHVYGYSPEQAEGIKMDAEAAGGVLEEEGRSSGGPFMDFDFGSQEDEADAFVGALLDDGIGAQTKVWGSRLSAGDSLKVKSFFDEFDFDWDTLAEEAAQDPVAGNYPALADALSSRDDRALRSAIRSGSGSGEGMSEDLKNLIDEFGGWAEEESQGRGRSASTENKAKKRPPEEMAMWLEELIDDAETDVDREALQEAADFAREEDWFGALGAVAIAGKFQSGPIGQAYQALQPYCRSTEGLKAKSTGALVHVTVSGPRAEGKVRAAAEDYDCYSNPRYGTMGGVITWYFQDEDEARDFAGDLYSISGCSEVEVVGPDTITPGQIDSFDELETKSNENIIDWLREQAVAAQEFAAADSEFDAGEFGGGSEAQDQASAFSDAADAIEQGDLDWALEILEGATQGGATMREAIARVKDEMSQPEGMDERSIKAKSSLDDPIPGAFDLAVDAVSGDAVSALQDARRLYVGGDVAGAADAVHDVVTMLGSLCPVQVMDLGSLLDGQPENTEGFEGASMKAISELEAFRDKMIGRASSGLPELIVEDGPQPTESFTELQQALDEAGIRYGLSNNGWTLTCDDTPQAREIMDDLRIEYEASHEEASAADIDIRRAAEEVANS